VFFVFGISSKEKEIDFSQTIICPSCGAYGRLNAFMTYTYFSLFFLPVFKWGKKYYLRSSCCGKLYRVDSEIGREIEKGRLSKINEEDLQPVNTSYERVRYCSSCSFPLERQFEYCPKCGNKL